MMVATYAAGRVRVAVLATTIVLLAGPAAAARATAPSAGLVEVPGGVELRVAGDDSGLAITVEPAGTGGFVVRFAAGGAAVAAGDGCAHLDEHTVSCPASGLVGIVARGGAGGDTLDLGAVVSVPVDVQGGGGSDVLVGGANADRLAGDDGDDVLYPGSGGGDVLIGDAGIDTVNLADSPTGVTVTLDDVANDGLAGAASSDVRSSIETVVGSEHADQLTGSDGDETLDGAGGDDLLDGAAGADLLLGGGGDDVLDADDGVADRLDCGEGGADRATIEALDDVRGCESVTLVSSDGDGDGSYTPADCNDGDPVVHPGAVEIPGNLVDEDCRGGPEPLVDGDRDGAVAGEDCDDGDPRRRPGAIEVPGNLLDEDCDGRARPLPPRPIPGRVEYSFASARTASGRGYIQILRLLVKELPAGVRARVICRGRGCPFRHSNARPRGHTLNLTRLVRDGRFGPGHEVIELRITKPGSLPRVDRISFAPPPKRPRLDRFCIKDGKRTTRC